MDITEVILKDHQEQRYLFSVLEQVDRASTEQLSAIWQRLRCLLEVHARAEELFFYPSLLRHGRGEGGMPDARSETLTLTARHALAIQFIAFETKNIDAVIPHDIDPETYIER
jgi:hypothetical protein